jgi:hypothetical protein
MKVEIDGIAYVPASEIGKGADNTARALLSAVAGGWYTYLNCHKTGESIGGATKCECTGCNAYRAISQFLGEIDEEEQTDPGFLRLWEASGK